MKVEITLTEEQIKKILAVVEKKKEGRFYPKVGDEYWFVEYNGVPHQNEWCDDIADTNRLFCGNVFKTEDEAWNFCKKIERTKAINRVNQYIDENGLRADSSDIRVKNIMMNPDSGIFITGSRAKGLSVLGDIRNDYESEKILEDCEKDLKTIFNS